MHPLQVRVFSLRLGKIVVSAQELSLAADDRTLSADGAFPHASQIMNEFEYMKPSGTFRYYNGDGNSATQYIRVSVMIGIS